MLGINSFKDCEQIARATKKKMVLNKIGSTSLLSLKKIIILKQKIFHVPFGCSCAHLLNNSSVVEYNFYPVGTIRQFINLDILIKFFEE